LPAIPSEVDNDAIVARKLFLGSDFSISQVACNDLVLVPFVSDRHHDPLAIAQESKNVM
jgi:hypothetical protein